MHPVNAQCPMPNANAQCGMPNADGRMACALHDRAAADRGAGATTALTTLKSANDRFQLAAICEGSIGFDRHVHRGRDVSRSAELEPMPARADSQSRTETRNVVDSADIKPIDVHLRDIRCDFELKISVSRLRCLRSRQREHRLNQRRFGRRLYSSRRGGREVIFSASVVGYVRIAAVRKPPPPVRQTSPTHTPRPTNGRGSSRDRYEIPEVPGGS